ncbi:MAG: hypothetical protein SOT16_03825 [Oscillospiraceae bacterium]|nr:hypothetical protein [Oscillospiraceae bacterium]
MLDLERVNAEIEKSGKKDRLKSLADSAEGRAVSRMLDPAAVEKAAKSGDTAALQSILSDVLSTDEGKRLAERLKKAMQ